MIVVERIWFFGYDRIVNMFVKESWEWIFINIRDSGGCMSSMFVVCFRKRG